MLPLSLFFHYFLHWLMRLYVFQCGYLLSMIWSVSIGMCACFACLLLLKDKNAFQLLLICGQKWRILCNSFLCSLFIKFHLLFDFYIVPPLCWSFFKWTLFSLLFLPFFRFVLLWNKFQRRKPFHVIVISLLCCCVCISCYISMWPFYYCLVYC